MTIFVMSLISKFTKGMAIRMVWKLEHFGGKYESRNICKNMKLI